MQRPWGERVFKVREEKGAVAWKAKQEPERQGKAPHRAWGRMLFASGSSSSSCPPQPPAPESLDVRWSAPHAPDQEGKLRNRPLLPQHEPLRGPGGQGSQQARPGEAGEEWVRPWHARTPSLPGPPPPSPSSWALAQPSPGGQTRRVLGTHRLLWQVDPHHDDLYLGRARRAQLGQAAAEIPTNVAHAYSVAAPAALCSHRLFIREIAKAP